MRAVKVVVFIVILYAAAAWGGEGEGYYQESNEYQIVFDSSSVTVIPDDITALLRECLEYIEDGSVDQGRALQAAIYRPLTRDGVAQDEADRAQYEAERYRRETALHGKIKEMITKLEGSK